MVMDREFTTASQTLANYTYSEIRSGTGFQDYFLIESEINTAKDKSYHLTEQRDFSNSIIIQQTASFDLDFDLSPFTIPQTANGDCKINLNVAGSSGDTTDLTAELYRVRGGVETQIGSTVLHRFTAAAAGYCYMLITVVNIQFAVGDILRLRLQKSSTTASTGIGIDPAGRTDATFTISTASKISIPYKLDL
jgi:hypothetical protein